jgi:death-on-curing protein
LKLLDAGTIVAINRLAIRLHGGMFLPPDNLRGGQDLGFADQIRVNRLFGQVLYPSPYHQAGAYLYYLVKNHSFNDGNKRTGLACALTILEWNDLPISEIETESAEAFVLSVATSQGDPGEEIERIATWLRPAIAPGS